MKTTANTTRKSMSHAPCLILIRHAQSENNALEDRFRVPDPNITPLGVSQSKKLASMVARIAPTVVYCSPFLRSLETTRWITEHVAAVPVVRQDIYEQGGCHSGFEDGKRVALPGMDRATLQSKYAGWDLDERIGGEGWYDLDHYETAYEARLRAEGVKRWYESESQSHHAGDRVAMVIHADFKLRLIEAFLGLPTVEEFLGDIVNTAISRLSLANGRWRLDYWNVHNHLDSTEISR